MNVLLFAVAGLMAIQVLCSLLYLARRIPHFVEEDMAAAVMVMVPCYNESDKELQKTIDSILMNDYPEENTVMVVVADGVITGRDQPRSTPETLGQILGFEFDPKESAYEYSSIGNKTQNFVSVYAGTYEKRVGKQCRSLKYMVLVKQGGLDERGTPRAGNRGKRDSQLILAQMLNRLNCDREPCELDIKVKQELDWLGVPLQDIEYLMAIDADTRVAPDAMKHMIYRLERNKNTLACCGETQVDNKSQSWVTMIQVFEYFSSHHMKKAFESVFGCVTCLPGCFTMYRLYTEEMDPLVASDVILKEYSRNDITSLHEKNLFELGEDRMLTTLLLQNFAGMSLQFVPEAVCWTIVPHTYSILLSQRRRWINSTLHNMFELLKVKTMCGIFCFSMKMVVICDMVTTVVLPASIAYLVYLIVILIIDPSQADPLVLYFIIATIGMMMMPFLLRARLDYMVWFVIYLIMGIPVFYFILPLYSFFHMDDFGWGKTREVAPSNGTGSNTIIMGDADDDDKSRENEDDPDATKGSSATSSKTATTKGTEVSSVAPSTKGESKAILMGSVDLDLNRKTSDVNRDPGGVRGSKIWESTSTAATTKETEHVKRPDSCGSPNPDGGKARIKASLASRSTAKPFEGSSITSSNLGDDSRRSSPDSKQSHVTSKLPTASKPPLTPKKMDSSSRAPESTKPVMSNEETAQKRKSVKKTRSKKAEKDARQVCFGDEPTKGLTSAPTPVPKAPHVPKPDSTDSSRKDDSGMPKLKKKKSKKDKKNKKSACGYAKKWQNEPFHTLESTKGNETISLSSSKLPQNPSSGKEVPPSRGDREGDSPSLDKSLKKKRRSSKMDISEEKDKKDENSQKVEEADETKLNRSKSKKSKEKSKRPKLEP
jgi:chitin synthase